MSRVHRSIICVDVESFGDPRRSDADRRVIRQRLYHALSTAFDGSGVPWQNCYSEDRGDGALVLVTSEIPKDLLVTEFPARLVTELAVHDQPHAPNTRIRLRVAVHAGEVQHDEYGVTGTAINLTFRLLDARPFKQILARSSGLLALATSDWFYTEVVRHTPESAPLLYRQIRVRQKETDTIAWVCLPDDPFPAESNHTPSRAPLLPDDRCLPPRQLPADTALFTGRNTEMSRLLALKPGGRGPAGMAPICAIDGMAGVGKTTLAVHAAHQLAEQFTDGCLFLDLHGYTHAVGPLTSSEALERVLRALGVPSARIPDDQDERAALYRSRLAGSRTLIVLDNASSAEQVRPLLPAEANCLVLVTSRRRLTTLDDALPLSLDVLSPTDALALFTTGAGPRRVEADDAEQVVDLCGRLPLAIRIAAARLRSRPAWTVADLAHRLAEKHSTLAELDDGERNVAAAFALSYSTLTADQQHLFRRLGLHPGRDTDSHAAAALAEMTVTQTTRLCEDLLDAHLLLQSTPGRYRYHDLIRVFAAEAADAEEPRKGHRKALTDLFDHYVSTASAAMNVLYPNEKNRRPHIRTTDAHIAPVAEPTTAQAWLDAERSNLVAVCAHGGPEHTILLAATLFRYLDIGGHLTDARAINQHALRAAADTGDRTSEAHFLTSLGSVHWNQGQYEHAAQAAEQALVIFNATGDRFGQARALSNLGIIYWRQGRYPEAAEKSRRALVLYRESHDLAGQARALGNLCLIHWRQGECAKAVRMVRRALTCYRDLGDRRGEARMLGNLGNVRHDQGRDAQAVHHHREALALYRETGDRIGEADALTNLGLPLRSQGHLHQAAEHHRKALDLYHHLGDRNGQARALNGLAESLNDLGHPIQARAHHSQALTIAQETGDRHEQARARTGLINTRRQ